MDLTELIALITCCYIYITQVVLLVISKAMELYHDFSSLVLLHATES